ncbi:MAG: alpha/beta hydrolase [Chitinophagales bacterium]
MKKVFPILFLVSFFFNTNAQENQFLVSSEFIASYTTDQLDSLWKENSIKQIIAPVNYAVDVYEIIYNSRWHDGSTIKASGFYFLPQNPEEKLATMIMNHGTELRKEQKHSIRGLQAVCTAFATDGYAALYPHYIGLGKGDSSHLYQMNDSEAYSNIDMLRAVREFNQENDVVTNNQLFITGYSQGGHATMAAHKMIQEEYYNEFTVTASAPMSGAYDMTGVQSDVMFEPYDYQGYLPYLLLSVEKQYDVWDGDIYEIFKPEYRDIIKEKVVNGEHGLRGVSDLLPEIPADMIIDSLVNEFVNNPDFVFNEKLALNNNYDWKPETPMRLCYCDADEQVSYKNAFVALDAMKANGAENVKLINGGKKYGHNKCALFTSIYAKFFFDSIRDGKEKGRKGPIFKRFLVSLAKMAVKP